MKIVDRIDSIASLFGLEPKASRNGRRSRRDDVPDWWHAIGEMGAWGEGVPNPAVYKTQADRYTKSPAFYAAVNRLAEAGAMTNVGVFDGHGPDAEPIQDHPFIDLLYHPAPNMEWLSLDKFTLIESILASLAVTGNCYLYLGGRSSPNEPPTILLPLRTDRMKPVPNKANGVGGYEYRVGGHKWAIETADIIHLRRWHPLNDFVGLSQVEPANYALATDLAAQKHNYATFKNSARLSLVVESDQMHVDPKDKKLMEQYILDTYTGDPTKAHKVAFLWEGFKVHDLGMNMRDAEYIEGRKLNRQDILMATGIHPALLMAEDVNLANAKVAEYLFAKYTLLPALTRIQMRFNAELMPLYGESHEMRFLDVVPRDVQQQLQRHTAYLDRAVMTINEVRQELGRDPVPWGDVPFMPQVGLMGSTVPGGEVVEGNVVEPPKALMAGGVDEMPSDELEAILMAAARVVARGA